MIGTILFSILIWMTGLIIAALGCILLFRLRKKIKNIISGKVEPYHFSDKEMEKVSGCFVNREEKYVASLGNGYIANFLANGGLKKGFAILSDKRVYFKGSCLTGTGRHLTKTNEERTVDNGDVTGSGFTFHRSYWRFIILILTAVVMLAAGYGELYSDDWYEPYSGAFVPRAWWYHVQDLQDSFEDEYYSKEIQRIEKDLELLRSLEKLSDDSALTENELWWSLWILSDDSELTEYQLRMSLEKLSDDCALTEDQRNLIIRLVMYDAYELGGSRLTFQRIEEEIETELKLAEIEHHDRLEEAHMNARMYAIQFSIGFVITILSIPIFSIAFLFLKDRKTYFEIQYAGGKIAFDVSFYAKAEIDEFQKQLRLAKDLATEQKKQAVPATPEQTPVKTASQTPVADTSETLMKYAEMLKNGLISQEEYDTLKKKLLGL